MTLIWISLLTGRRPDGADELSIPLAALRSDAAELALLAQERQRLPTRFVSAHTQQTLRKIESTRKELDQLRLRDDTLAQLRDDARKRAAHLADEARRLR